MAEDHQNLDNPIEKQMGCMAGFLHIFDRHHKKLHTTKRLISPPLPVKPSLSESHNHVSESIHVSKELGISQKPKSPMADLQSPQKTMLPFPIFELKELKEGRKSPWKFKETHRLSLDSRASYDAKGGLHRKDIPVGLPTNLPYENDDNDGGNQKARSSTSVIAKLMGFEPIQQLVNEPEKLKRSASESRLNHRFIDGGSNNQSINQIESIRQQQIQIQTKIQSKNQSKSQSQSSVSKFKVVDPIGRAKSEAKGTSSSWRLAQHRKSFFEPAEIFPEPGPKQPAGEKDRRMKMKVVHEASNDLETLKQILEVWQLKGLLHSNKQQFSRRNLVYDQTSPGDRSMGVKGAQRNVKYNGERAASVSPRRERNVRSPTRARSSSSPTRSEGNGRRTNTIVKPKSLTVETGVNGSTEKRRVNSPPPRVGRKRSGAGSGPVVANRPGRIRKKTTPEIREKEKITTAVVTEDETCSSSTSQRSKMEECKEGRSLLERCGKLLNSIAEMNGRDQQSSPVSVLDSSFFESESPSPIMKRNIDFRGVSGELLEEDTWSQLTFTSRSKSEDSVGSEHYGDLAYISDILRSSHYLPANSDIFSLLEKQRCVKGRDASQESTLHRKLIFDIINEILERDRKSPAFFSSWKDYIPKGSSSSPSLQQIWSEFLKIREHEYYGDDMVDVICGVLKKDLNSSRDTMNGWGECRAELSEVVLYIERMIFRDLVSETINDLATLASQSSNSVAYRRKLVF